MHQRARRSTLNHAGVRIGKTTKSNNSQWHHSQQRDTTTNRRLYRPPSLASTPVPLTATERQRDLRGRDLVVQVLAPQLENTFELEIVSLPVDWCEAQVASDYSSWHLHLGDVGIGLEYGTKNNAVSRNKQLLAQHTI